MSAPALKRYGERALLVELDLADRSAETAAREVAGWAAAIRDADRPDVVDVVPAARSVLVHCTSEAAVFELRRTIAGLQPLPADTGSAGQLVEIPVTYDGPDLREVAELSGLSLGDVVRAHVDSEWWVAFAGFAPGFAYLVGGDPRLAVPRRASPRTRVPLGAVALAAGYTAVYPQASPGGWQLIGRTDRALWNLADDPPALLVPGTRVTFVRADR
ncbi:MAG: 5-oxoprolinase subunit B family protein [Actinomycetales bacterium]